MVKNKQLRVYFFIWLLCIGFTLFRGKVFAQNPNLYQEEEIKDQEKEELIRQLEEEQRIESARIMEELSDKELEERQLVEVESNNIIPSDLANIGMLVPYKYRRTKWGSLFTISYVQMNFTSFEPTYSAVAYEDIYGADTGMIEAAFDIKYNFSLGALSAQLAYGALGSSGSDGTTSSDISLSQLRMGLKFTADNLFNEPIVAPYVGGGIYNMNYKESSAGDSAGGITDPALYFLFGSYFQVDWLDSTAAVEAYSEGGIENTYLFLEARNYMASETAQDPDFSTEFSLSGGLSLEF